MYGELKLKNGLRIVHEKMPHVRSASIGVWVGAGSRCESRKELGYAHFVEHMMFKGTASRSASELASAMDSMGGQVNAYTAKELTCYHARVPDYHLDAAIDLLGEMLLESAFAQEDVDSERGVILEEMDMYRDSPEDLAADRLMEKSLRGALGKNGLGTAATLSAATGQALRAFRDRYYTPDRIVVSLCGQYGRAQLEHIAAVFGAMQAREAPAVRRSGYSPAVTVRRKATEQNHLVLAWPGCAAGSGERFTQQLLATILGGGMSSRLFQSLREKHGLCYNIYTFSSAFRDVGLFGIATALGGDTEERALELILGEVESLCRDGVSDGELERAVDQARASLLMAQESTYSRMSRNGSGVLTLGSCLSPDEVIARYEAVTAEDVRRYAGELLRPERCSLSAVGRVRAPEAYAGYIRCAPAVKNG